MTGTAYAPRRMVAPIAALLLIGGLLPFAAEAAAPAAARSCLGAVATIVGTSGDDVLHGTPHADVIVGRGGDDRINGRGGDDLICGGAGRDLLSGAGGSDQLDGDGGKDALAGGRGDDELDGGASKDRCSGGPGKDLLERCELGPNAAPAAANDAASTDEDTATTVPVLDNDTDPDRHRLVVLAVDVTGA
jgi:hypothetical protein